MRFYSRTDRWSSEASKDWLHWAALATRLITRLREAMSTRRGLQPLTQWQLSNTNRSSTKRQDFSFSESFRPKRCTRYKGIHYQGLASQAQIKTGLLHSSCYRRYLHPYSDMHIVHIQYYTENLPVYYSSYKEFAGMSNITVYHTQKKEGFATKDLSITRPQSARS
jgi:hypothetical protein